MGNNTPPAEDRDYFIEKHMGFIYKAACRVCKRKLSFENDDELSIAMIAFNNACDTYEKIKGNFTTYANVIIKNSLIDYFRKSSGKTQVVLAFNSEDEAYNEIEYKSSLNQFDLEAENRARAEEIKLLSEKLNEFNLDFNTLVSSSPSHRDTRSSLLNIAFSCVRNEDILNKIHQKKQLPISEIILLTKANRKYLEKWRRYLIALILVLSGDYPYIKSYLDIKVGVDND